MGTDELNLVGNYIVYSAIIPLGIFIFFYMKKSPWWANDIGVATLSSKWSQFLVFATIGASLFFGLDYPGREWVRFTVFTYVVFTMWLDVFNLVRYQRAFLHQGEKRLRWPGWIEILKRYFRPPVD